MHRFLVPLVAAVLLLAAPAGAAVRCPVPAPGSPLPRASSAQAGLDQAQLDLAVHAIQDRRSYAIRVLRHGCLVGEDTHANEYRDQLWEGHGLTSAVVGLLAGRAMELGRLDPDDPVGALVPEAGRELGGATVADLLARASGLRPEPEDRSVPDPLRLALATPVVAPPGSRFGDAPTALAVLGEVVARAAGRDLVAFAGA
jgi:CubicO group peptidase (beta-lactamase class C family)